MTRNRHRRFRVVLLNPSFRSSSLFKKLLASAAVLVVVVGIVLYTTAGGQTWPSIQSTVLATVSSSGHTGGAPHDATDNITEPHDGTSHEAIDEAEAKDPHLAQSDHEAGVHHAVHRIVATRPAVQDVRLTRPYVCQIHSRRHIDVKALEGGYLKSIEVREGQSVMKGQTMFHILPTLYSARLDADMAEAEQARVEFENTQSLVGQNIVSNQELKVAKANLAKSLAKVKLARAEMNFADIVAPFDGIIDRLHEQEGSLIEEGAMLTTLSDNTVMWVYFNVPETQYLQYQSARGSSSNPSKPPAEDTEIELRLANGKIFGQTGTIGAIEADFDNETGTIPFRADFPNPDGLLRHGQTGTVLMHRVRKGAVVIPQRATFEILDKKYVYVVDDGGVVHQRLIDIGEELDDIYLIDDGVKPDETIVLEGILQVRDGDKIAVDFQSPDEVLSHLKHDAQ